MCFICRLSSSLTCCFTSADPLQFVTAAGRVQKLAVSKALSSAFQKILLVVLGKTWRGAAQGLGSSCPSVVLGVSGATIGDFS